MPRCTTISLNKPNMERALLESSSPVGSSASIRAARSRWRGLWRRAAVRRPIARKGGDWRGSTVRLSPAPRARVLRVPAVRTPAILSGNSTFSNADSNGSSPNDWKTKPILCRRRSVRSRSPISAMSRFSNSTCPDVGLSKPARMFSSVVLPLPERPTTGYELPGHDAEVDAAQRFDGLRS